MPAVFMKAAAFGLLRLVDDPSTNNLAGILNIIIDIFRLPK